MKKRDLAKMSLEEKKAIRKAAAKVMGENIIYEQSLRNPKEIPPDSEMVS